MQLVPAKEYNGPPIGNSYDVRVYVGELKKLADFLGLRFLGSNERMHFEQKTMGHRNSKRGVITSVNEVGMNVFTKGMYFSSSTQLRKNSKHSYRITEYSLLTIRVRSEAWKK